MKGKLPAMPDIMGLSSQEKQIYAFVLEHWPSTPLEIAEEMKEDTSCREKKKRASTKYAYYLKKLIQKKLLLSKKAGNSIIVWPVMVEKYRAIHNILNHHEAEHLELLYHKHQMESETHA